MGKVNFPYLSRSLPDHPLSGGWWLLDAETNGLHPEEGDELIALRLAYMKKDTILETCEMRIRPAQPLPSHIERLTGVTNAMLENAMETAEAVSALEDLTEEGPLILWHGAFLLPFFQKAFLSCGKAFDLPHLLLETVASLVLGEKHIRTLKAMRMQLELECDSSIANQSLASLHALTVELFRRLEQRGIHTTKELETWYRSRRTPFPVVAEFGRLEQLSDQAIGRLVDAFPGLELALALKGVDNEMRSRFLRIRPGLMERMELCCYPRLIDVECAQKLVLEKLEAIAGCHEENGLPIEPCTGS